MVGTIILENDENGDLHDQEGHMRNAACQRLDYQRAVILDQDDDIAAVAQALDVLLDPKRWLTTIVQINTTPTNLLFVLLQFSGQILS